MKIGYARVSTLSQPLENQIEALQTAGCEKIFSEKKSGKAAESRQELHRAIEFGREGDTFTVTRLDRLARSTPDLHRIAQELQRKGVELVVLHQQIDTGTPTGRLLFSMLGAIAEFERDLINERAAEGRKKAQERGVKFGRKQTLDDGQMNALQADIDADLPISKEALAVKYGVSRATIFRAASRLKERASAWRTKCER